MSIYLLYFLSCLCYLGVGIGVYYVADRVFDMFFTNDVEWAGLFVLAWPLFLFIGVIVFLVVGLGRVAQIVSDRVRARNEIKHE